jgi:CxxC motif-containing protein (DUF1111 family)
VLRSPKVSVLLSFLGLFWSIAILFNVLNLFAKNPDAPGQLKKNGQTPGVDAAGIPMGTTGHIPPGQLKKRALVTPPPTPPPQVTPTPALNGFGALLAGVTAKNKQDWLVGRTQFQTPEDSGDLGPIFNANPNNPSCFACHSSPDVNGKPVVGGGSALTELRTFGPGSGFNLVRLFATIPAVQDLTPLDTTLQVRRGATPLFGVGFIEQIPDAEIIVNAQTPQADGVHGRAVLLNDSVTTQIVGGNFVGGSVNRVGRFGWHCQQASLLAFAADASFHELGERNPFFLTDDAPHVNGNPVVSIAALIAAEPGGVITGDEDPPSGISFPGEAPKTDRDRYRDFMEFNEKPPQVPFTAQAIQGQQIFTGLNCVACHKPNATTGQDLEEPQLSFQNFQPFSDFLVHDMGSLADGIDQSPGGGPREARTAPLWGLRARPALLHDFRFSSDGPGIINAILAHDGEGKIIRDRFANLPPDQQAAVVAFLLSI